MASFRPCRNPDCGVLIDSETMRKYCSNRCKQKVYRSRTKGRILQQPFQAIKRCAYCGKTFTAKNPTKRCCSRAHKQALYRELKKLETESHDYSV